MKDSVCDQVRGIPVLLMRALCEVLAERAHSMPANVVSWWVQGATCNKGSFHANVVGSAVQCDRVYRCTMAAMWNGMRRSTARKAASTCGGEVAAAVCDRMTFVRVRADDRVRIAKGPGGGVDEEEVVVTKASKEEITREGCRNGRH